MMSVIPVDCTSIPMPTEVAAVWGGFLYEGLLSHLPDPKRMNAILDSWGQGCIELVIAGCLHLPEVWKQISQTWESYDTDMPGVFEYEVVSPLGTYLADYLLSHDGKLPSKEEVATEITRLIQSFFSLPEKTALLLSQAS